MMMVESVWLLALSLAAQSPDAWVEKLSSGSVDERANAAKALEELGEAALPVLRQAERSPDPELRARAEVLIARVEAGGASKVLSKIDSFFADAMSLRLSYQEVRTFPPGPECAYKARGRIAFERPSKFFFNREYEEGGILRGKDMVWCDGQTLETRGEPARVDATPVRNPGESVSLALKTFASLGVNRTELVFESLSKGIALTEVAKGSHTRFRTKPIRTRRDGESRLLEFDLGHEDHPEFKARVILTVRSDTLIPVRRETTYLSDEAVQLLSVETYSDQEVNVRIPRSQWGPDGAPK